MRRILQHSFPIRYSNLFATRALKEGAFRKAILIAPVILVFFILLLLPSTAKSDHFQGGYYTYTYLGGGKYEFLIKGYWRKNGVATLFPRYNGSHVINSSTSVSKTLLPDGETVEHVQKEVVTWAKPGFYEVYYNPCCMGHGSNYDHNPIGIYATVNYDPSVNTSAPDFYDFPLYNYQAGQPIHYKFDVKDPDGHEQEFALELPAGLTGEAYAAMRETGFELKTDGTMTWENPIAGKWLVQIRVREKINGQFTGTYIDRLFIMTIKSSTENQPPVFGSLEHKVVPAGSMLDFDMDATDASGQLITLNAHGTPFKNGAAFSQTTTGNSVKGRFSWRPLISGTYTVHFLAIDDHATKMYSRYDLTITVVDCIEIATSAEIKRPCMGSNNGQLSINATGGYFPYAYSIDNGLSFQVNPDFENLSSGTYHIIVKDGKGCFSAAKEILFEELPLPDVQLSLPEMICFTDPGFELFGGSPQGGSYEGTGVANGFYYPSLAGVGTHILHYTYTDENGCTQSAAASVTVNQGPVADAGDDTEVYIKKNGKPHHKNCTTLSGGAIGGSFPYSYQWSTGETTQMIEVCPAVATSYTLTVTDANGCSATSDVKVEVYENGDKPEKGKDKDKEKGKKSKSRIDNSGIAAVDSSFEGLTVYPNPVNELSQLSISLKDKTLIKIEILDLSGSVIKTVFNGNQNIENGFSIAIGSVFPDKATYICRVITNESVYFVRLISQ